MGDKEGAERLEKVFRSRRYPNIEIIQNERKTLEKKSSLKMTKDQSHKLMENRRSLSVKIDPSPSILPPYDKDSIELEDDDARSIASQDGDDDVDGVTDEFYKKFAIANIDGDVHAPRSPRAPGQGRANKDEDSPEFDQDLKFKYPSNSIKLHKRRMYPTLSDQTLFQSKDKTK